MDALLGGAYHRILWIQSVRQGKTAGCVIGMVKHAIMNDLMGVGNREYLLGQVSVGLLLDTQYKYWLDVSEQLNLPLSVTREPRAKLRLGPYLFHLAGGDNEGSAHRIMGLTVTSAWLDEVVELKESFIETAYDRCSFAESVLIMTGNAGKAGHFIEERYIQPDEPPPGTKLMVDGGVDDNGYMDEERIDRYINDTARDPVHYARKIMNVWAADSGLVYTIEPHMKVDPIAIEGTRGFVSMDPGIAGTTVMLYWVKRGQVWYIADEVYYHRASAESVINGEVVARAHTQRGWQFNEVVVDPSALKEMKDNLINRGYRVIGADNDVDVGVRTVNHRLIDGSLKICKNSTGLLRECNVHKWDKHEQRPVKENDHGPDALRYGAMHVLPLLATTVTGEAQTSGVWKPQWT